MKRYSGLVDFTCKDGKCSILTYNYTNGVIRQEPWCSVWMPGPIYVTT